ncbi:acyl carrier protein [Lyngbya confervoides]|uniref:Acyl carrier protein n=1 Tax=Lyngbya confervoides BDU141951 TaxID=1574623 RepID=A0ABD4T8U6_9CYAN|nr:acyl carrier protein [Lyngbya confervoides]MCM1984982.1 acyl carrier protein [Lyngbya confervoides BDU141951]
MSKSIETLQEKSKEAKKYHEIQSWLVAHLAHSLDLDPDMVNIHQDFTDYGLSSVEMVNISGDLEEYLNCRLDPMLVLERPNIHALSDYLANSTSAKVSDRASFHPEAQQLLAELDTMSDEEVDQLLNTMLSAQELTEEKFAVNRSLGHADE